MKAPILRNILAAAAAIVGWMGVQALPTGHFTAKSRLSSGKWVKIRVSDTGMQAISSEQLRQWGFSDPAKVAVYGYGNAELAGRQTFSDDLPDDLQQTAILRHGNRLIFYGEATSRLVALSQSTLEYINNVYDNYGYYFLSDCESPVPIEYKEYNAGNSAGNLCTSHLSAQIIQPDNRNPMSGGAYWLGPELTDKSAIEYSFAVKAFEPGTGSAGYGTMGYTFVAANDSDTTTLNVLQPTNVDVPYSVNRYTAPTVSGTTFFNIATGSAHFRPRTKGDLEDSRLTYGFRLHCKNSRPHFAAIKNAWIIYRRRNDMCGESQLPMTFPAAQANQNFAITSQRKVEVWNISDLTAIHAYRTVYDNNQGITCGSFDRNYGSGKSAARLIAFDPDGEMYSPEFHCDVPNQNIHGDDTPHMVIISTDELYEAACELAVIHRSFGDKVNVYTHRQVLNEFGSGGASPMAYRLMVKMFYDRDPECFRHLLLYGPTTWDFRGLTMPSNEYLLTFMADRERHFKEISANFSSDAYFGMVADDFSPTKIEMADNLVAVGRLNVTNSGSGHDMNMKIQRYMHNPPDPATYARMMVISCDGDANAHFYQGQNAADITLANNPAFTATRAHVSLYPVAGGKADFTTRKALAAMNQGVGIMDYTGHGDQNNLGRGNAIVWQKSNSAGLTNSRLPLLILSTCSAYSPDHGNNDIATSFTFKPDAGAIAAIGACRKVYLAYNGVFNNALLQCYATSTPGTTIGDLYRHARHTAIANSGNNRDALANTMCYNLCGDPLVPLPVPDYKAAITSINGNQVHNGRTTTVAPGDKTTLSGRITDNNGQTVTGFNGSIRAIVYDSPINKKQLLTEGTDTVRTIALEEEILAEMGGRVKNGEFILHTSMPRPRTAGKRNRIILSAMTDYGGQRYSALGYTNDFAIDPDATPSAPQQGRNPVITAMYIDSPDFRSGDRLAVDRPHTFHAIVRMPGTGISNASAIIGATPRLTLDGRRDFDGICSDYTIDSQGNYIFTMPLNCEFTHGYHDLKFTLPNTIGESGSRSISFMVTPAEYTVDVTINEPTATRSATIEARTDASSGIRRLQIADNLGNTIFSADGITLPYRWNLKDNSGHDVPDGRYTVTVLVADGDGCGASQPVQITVVRR